MSDLYPVAGTKFFIGGAMASQIEDVEESDFDGETWVEVDGFSQMGAFGDTAALITTPLINRGRDVKQKGTFNAGQMQNVFAKLDEDPGQIALIAASRTRNNYAFRLVFDDAPAGGTPSERFFIGLVMNAEEQGGDANTVLNLAATIEINSNIVRVAAAEA